MRKDLEDWLRGNENPLPAASGLTRRVSVVPDDAGEGNFPVVFLLDLPIVSERKPLSALNATPKEEFRAKTEGMRTEELSRQIPPEGVQSKSFFESLSEGFSFENTQSSTQSEDFRSESTQSDSFQLEEHRFENLRSGSPPFENPRIENARVESVPSERIPSERNPSERAESKEFRLADAGPAESAEPEKAVEVEDYAVAAGSAGTFLAEAFSEELPKSAETLETGELVEAVGSVETLAEDSAESREEVETGGSAEADFEKIGDAGPEELDDGEFDDEELDDEELDDETELAKELIGFGPVESDAPVGLSDFAEDAVPSLTEESLEKDGTEAGDLERKNDSFLSESSKTWDAYRFEERLRRIEVARQLAFRQQRFGFLAQYGRFVVTGIVVFCIIGAIFLTYSHLRHNSYSFLMKDAEVLYNSERYEDSLKAYREISLLYPNRVEPFLGVARASERVGQIEEAIEAYKCVLDLQPFFDFAQNELTRVFLTLEKSADKPEPENLSVGGDANAQEYDNATQMGTIALLAGNYGEASRYFADALAIRSDDAGVWVSLSDAQIGLGGVEEAVKSLKTALLKNPANEEAKAKLADIEKAAAVKTEKKKKEKEKKETKQPVPKKTRNAKGRKTAGGARFQIRDAGGVGNEQSV